MTVTLESQLERRVTKRVVGHPTSDGAGVKLTRVIGGPALPMLDPFLLLDEFGSDDPGAYIGGFPDHPHRGFETVTYMLAGRMRHGDSKGNSGLLGPGSVQWMTAGRGLVHSEMPEQSEGLMRGFQLWINLPARLKMTEPRYQDVAPDRIPEVPLPGGGRVRVIAGRFAEAVGPVEAEATEPLYLDIRLQAGSSTTIEVPPTHAAFLFPYAGRLQVGRDHDAVEAHELAVLEDGSQVTLAAEGEASAILVAGKPIGERVARYGPFVMNSEAELRQAFADFQAGRF